MPQLSLALGLLSSLARPALAEDIPEVTPAEAPPPFQLSYELTRTADGLGVRMFATNTTRSPVTLDDNPHIRSATLVLDATTAVALAPPPDVEMYSRAGPMRRWLTLKPGERMLVGTSQIEVPAGQPTEHGQLLLTVEAITPAAITAQSTAIPLTQPGT